jgi:hypothetical protein
LLSRAVYGIRHLSYGKDGLSFTGWGRFSLRVASPLLLVRMPPDETIFRRRRKRPETKAAYLPQPPNHGDRHLDPPPQRDLPRNPQRRSSRHCPRKGKAMTEAVMALLVLFSISVFLAHAFDAYRMR